jgi:3-hydroxyisobutyrate dehydrogenase
LAGFAAQSSSTPKAVVDMTTSEPNLAKEIYDQAKQRGFSAIDAPVSGGRVIAFWDYLIELK